MKRKHVWNVSVPLSGQKMDWCNLLVRLQRTPRMHSNETIVILQAIKRLHTEIEQLRESLKQLQEAGLNLNISVNESENDSDSSDTALTAPF